MPTFGTRPVIISEEGEARVSIYENVLAVVKNLLQVSKLIFKNGDIDSSMHILFIYLIFPSNVI